MATTTLTTEPLGLSTAELESELARELPAREEMSGFHRWFHHSCYHPCFEYVPCYEGYASFETSVTVVTQVSAVTTVFPY